jgi:hypothetical protein
LTWDRVISSGTRVARKDYHCEACDWLDNSCIEGEMEPEDEFLWQKIQQEGCKISKGEEYYFVTGSIGGEISTFKARIDANNLCNKYDLYQE